MAEMVVFEPIPMPEEGCDHPLNEPVPTVGGMQTPSGEGAMRCARCWKVYPEEEWPSLREKFDRDTAIVFLLEIIYDLSDEEKNEWLSEFVNQLTKEKIYEYIKELQ